MRMEDDPRIKLLGPVIGRLFATILGTIFPAPGPCLCGRCLGGRGDFVRQIWCRDQRQALSMGTVGKRAQGESGKQNLTHHMLWVCDGPILLGKRGCQAVNRNRAENFFAIVTARNLSPVWIDCGYRGDTDSYLFRSPC